MEWEPIETAPKDGRNIAVYDRRTGYVPFVYWDIDDGEWVSHYLQWGGNPTHWMPLPEPPEEN